MAPSLQPFSRRNSYSENWSYCLTISSQAAWPSRSTIARRSPMADSHSWSAVRPRSWSARVKGSRDGWASASAIVIRSPLR